MKLVNDWRKMPIHVGSVIVYATTASSSVTMNEAIVAKIEFVPETRYNYHPIDPVTNKRPSPTPYTVDVPVLYVRKTVEHAHRTVNTKANQAKLQKLTRVDRVTVVEHPDPNKCNFEGCTAEEGHDDALTDYYWPAHSFERTE